MAGTTLALSGWLIRPISRPAALALVLLPLCFTGRALLSGGILGPVDMHYRTDPWRAVSSEYGVEGVHNGILSDVYSQVIPWRQAVRHALDQGEWPLWNPYILTGQVLSGCGQAAAYHPLNIAALALPLSWSLTFSATSVFFLAGLAGFLYIRELECREQVAVIGAAGWMFCGFLTFWLEWSMGLTVAAAPAVFLGVRRVTTQPGIRSASILTAAFVLVLLAGHPESALHIVSVAAIYGVYELAATPRQSRPAAVVSALFAGFLALGLSAVELMTVAEAIPQTVQHHERRLHYAGSDRSVELAEVPGRAVVNLVPFRYGAPESELVDREKIPPNLLPWSTAYVGSVLLAPAVFGLWRSRWRGRWVLAFLGGLGILAGASAPGITDLLAHLPMFDIAINRRLVFVGGIALAALAALGLEQWAQNGGDRRLGALHLIVATGLGALVAVAWPGMRADGLSRVFLAESTAVLLVPTVAAGLVMSLSRKVGFGLAAILLLLLGQRVLEDGQTYPVLPQRAFYPVVEPLESLPRDGAPYRLVGLSRILIPNSSALYGIEDPRGYEAAVHHRFFGLSQLWSRQLPVWFNEVDDLDSPFLDMINVRYALAPQQYVPPPEWRIVGHGPGVTLLENSRVLERAFIPEVVRVGSRPFDGAEEISAVTDFGRLSFVELTSAEATDEALEIANGPGRITIHRKGSGYRLDLEMDGPGWVILTETAWRGWRVLLDGIEQPTHFGNYAYLAFHVPEGAHHAEVFYRPRAFVIGRAVSFCTGIGAIVFLVGRRYRRRGLNAGTADDPP